MRSRRPTALAFTPKIGGLQYSMSYSWTFFCP
jgi:hypothetical protein